MKFISRVLLSWALFLFLVVQGLDDDNVIKTLASFAPLVLSVVATTYLVHDLILCQILPDPTSDTTSSSSVDWAQPSALVITRAPIATLTPLSAGVIDKPEVSIWPGLFSEYTLLAFLAVAISVALIAWRSSRHTVALDHPALFPSQLEPTICRLPSSFTAHRCGTARLAPKAQPISFTCLSYLSYSPSQSGPESTTTEALNQTLPNHGPVVTLPPPIEDDPPRSTESDQNIEQLLPLLRWNFTLSSAFEEEGDDDLDDDKEDLWFDTEDHETLQIKEVLRGVVPCPSRAEDDDDDAAQASIPAPNPGPCVQVLTPTGKLNPNIEFVQSRLTQGALAFPSCVGGKHENSAPTATPTPQVAPRVRLRVPAAKPSPNIQSLKPRPAPEGIQFPLREDKDEDDKDQAIQPRCPSFVRPPAPSRPLPPIPTGRRKPNIELMQRLKLLPACLEEEEEEEEEFSDQDRCPLSTSKPNHDESTSTGTSTTSTAVETPTSSEAHTVSGKPSAMKKNNTKKKTATVSFFHLIEVRDHPMTICDIKARCGFVSEEEEQELDQEYLLLVNLVGSDDEEVEEVRWIPLASEEVESPPSLLSWNAKPQDGAAVEKINPSARLRKVFSKFPPLRSGKRLLEKKTGRL
ncbi:hypothetical protein M407DRAFT_24631 [Tulasnella calospora MUT 4182]|uniref:Uncharacterized protein n=1 Tax=Tulasnella calospora MUT 4182 TaxID=1051891 RepID=A0A0C3LXA7_9AGAM|nr:hypothetical protein M407DRAFT_24631 [Tulasnella calospora MUT 4182]